MKYEYKTVRTWESGSSIYDNENTRNYALGILNKEGEDGWKFVGWYEDGIYALMERQLNA